MAAHEALHRQVQVIQFTDAEIKRILTNSNVEAARIMKVLSAKGTSSASVRSAQVALANAVTQMWGSVGDAVKVGIGDGVWNATEASALFDERLFQAAGLSSTYWRASMMETAKQGVEALISRRENGITLAESVYKNSALTKGWVSDAINKGLALGKTPAEIAASVKGYINPATPGGASYAAMRLGRSEVVNAYHTTALRRYNESPWIERVRWNLSGRHTRPDECNDYAEKQIKPGWGVGVWPTSEVPAKPHPQCLCYVTPLSMDLEEFAKKYEAGKYDSYINQQMGCYRGV
jgi:hypothetical protein